MHMINCREDLFGNGSIMELKVIQKMEKNITAMEETLEMIQAIKISVLMEC